MSYAYWRKCDFQVHTPRDPNWEGPRPAGIDTAPVEDVDAARMQRMQRLLRRAHRAMRMGRPVH